jgi:hypothetical protein
MPHFTQKPVQIVALDMVFVSLRRPLQVKKAQGIDASVKMGGGQATAQHLAAWAQPSPQNLKEF